MSNTMYIFMKQSLYLKFRHYEKAQKFEKVSHLFWQNNCFYSVSSKQVGDFFQIFVAFSGKLDFIIQYCKFCTKNSFLNFFLGECRQKWEKYCSHNDFKWKSCRPCHPHWKSQSRLKSRGWWFETSRWYWPWCSKTCHGF